MEVRLTPAERKAAQQAEAQSLARQADRYRPSPGYYREFVDPYVDAIVPRIGPGPDRPVVHSN